LSSADILISLVLGGAINYDPKNLQDPKRDRFILSCGHVAPAYYAVLSEAKFFDPSWLLTLREIGSSLQGHPSFLHADFIESSTGSLGQGLSVGAGMALGLKIKGDKNKVFVLSSDGEQNEGSVWETMMFASFWKLGNLCLIIDQNKMQIGGETKTVLSQGKLGEKFKAFGWAVFETDGHDFRDILSVFSRFNENKNSPKVVICRTVRGKGVSFMEKSEKYHSATLTEEEYKKAMEELS
jgi:transketolase